MDINTEYESMTEKIGANKKLDNFLRGGEGVSGCSQILQGQDRFYVPPLGFIDNHGSANQSRPGLGNDLLNGFQGRSFGKKIVNEKDMVLFVQDLLGDIEGG